MALFLGLSRATYSSVTSSTSYAAPFAKVPPPIEPSLESPIWNQGILASDFTNVLTKAPGRQKTKARILFDTKNVYVVIECDQPNQRITANPAAQDFGRADFAGIGIDPSGNGQNVYYFGATPTGHQYFLNSRTATYFPKWTAKSQVGATSWSAILVIPYDVLVLRQSSMQTWRINVVRHVAQTNDDLTWAYNPLMTIPANRATAAGLGFGVGGSPEAQAQQNALNAQNQNANPLGLIIWPTTADAQYWPTVTGSIPERLLPAVDVTGAALYSAGVNRNLFFQQANGGSYIQQGIPYTSYSGTYHFAPSAEVTLENNEFPLIPNSAQGNDYLTRPLFNNSAFQQGRQVPTSTTAGPDTVIATWNIAETNQAYKLDGALGLQSFDVTNAVGQGMNDTLIGMRHEAPGQSFSWWLNSALTHHGAGYVGYDTREGSTQTAEFGFGGRNPITGFSYLASYALESGKFPTAPLSPNAIIDPGLASKTELLLGVVKPFYSVQVFHTDVGPQFSPADGSVNVAGIRGFGAEATANGAGGRTSWIRSYQLRGYGIRTFDLSGYVNYSDDEFSANVVTKQNINLAAGELLTTRSGYALGSPVFPQFTGYPVDYAGRAYGKLGSSALMVGYNSEAPTFVNVSYVYGPSVIFTFVPPRLPSYLNGYQQTWTAVGQTYLLGFKLQGAYGINHGYYPGTASTLIPGNQNEGQTLRYASLGRSIDPYTSFVLGYQSVVGSPFGASSPTTFFSAKFVRYLLRGGGQFSVSYGSPPLAPYFAFSRAVSTWTFPSYVIGCLPGNGLCQLNRFLIQYQRNVGLFGS